ncbi:MAG: hypothetical protein Q4E83_00470 [bacterium]|nr:hypothetical protein [bacterium]
MLFITESVKTEELNKINNFLNQYEDDAVKIIDAEEVNEAPCLSKYITSVVSVQYKDSVEKIANTVVGNKLRRKRNFQQIMQESFFYGANRFGNNFIA